MDTILAGVFDGHGKEGDRIASFVRNTFLLQFVQKEGCLFKTNLEASFLETNQMLIDCSSIDSRRSGTTAFLLLIENSSSSCISLHSLNIGDSE